MSAAPNNPSPSPSSTASQVDPLDEDGVGAVAVGTVCWAVVLVVLLVLRDRLAASGAEWWIAVAATGLGLGGLGLGYTTRRRAAYRRTGASRGARS